LTRAALKKKKLERKNTNKPLAILFNFRDIYYVSILCNNPDLIITPKRKEVNEWLIIKD
jgi:virulence-associated protein VagC